MKTRSVLVVAAAAALMLAGLTAPTRAAEDDGPLQPGRWMPDVTAYDPTTWDGNLHFERLTRAQPGARVPGWWWQRTTNQNAIIDRMNWEGTTYPLVPREPIPGVYFFGRPESGVLVPPTGTAPAGGGPITDVSGGAGNLVVVETQNYTILIGTGGNTYNTEGVLSYIRTYIQKPLRWVIVPDMSDASIRDVSAAAKYATAENPLTVITAFSLLPALDKRGASYPTNVVPPNWSTLGKRIVGVNGGLPILPSQYRVPRDLNWRLSPPYSSSGSPLLCPTVAPYDDIPATPNVQCIYVQSSSLTLNLQDVSVRLMPAIPSIGGLTTYFPGLKVLIPPSLFGGYLPDLAPLTGPVIPSREVLDALSQMLTLDVDMYASLHLPPMTPRPGYPDAPRLAIEAQQAVLQALSAYTLEGLRTNTSLEDLVAGVSLPQSVLDKCALFGVASPCNELHSTLGLVVRGIYQEYAGWFDGSERNLATHLTSADRAQVLVDAAGGTDKLLAIAKKVQSAAQDLKSVERALLLIEPLYELTPNNPYVTAVYYQALYKAGLMQKDTQLRNYYLWQAWMIRPTTTP